MIRPLIVAAVVVALAACKPAEATEPAAAPATTAAPSAPATAAAADPASFDWHFVTHGGSGDLDFGDGDWAEGEALFHLSCLPESGNVEASWGNPQPVRLTAGGATLDLTANEAGALGNDAVFRALTSSGEITVTQGAETKVLTGKAAGKKAVAEFFDYCNTVVE